MFGKPEWFRPKRFGWGLTPITWQGWVYTAIWSLVMIVPFLLLLLRSQSPEAMLWLTATIALLLWDVYLILRAMRCDAATGKTNPPSDDASPNDASDVVETENLRMRLRDR